MDAAVIIDALAFSISTFAMLVVEHFEKRFQATSPLEAGLGLAVIAVTPFALYAFSRAVRAKRPLVTRRAISHAGFGADLSTQVSVNALEYFGDPEHNFCPRCGAATRH